MMAEALAEAGAEWRRRAGRSTLPAAADEIAAATGAARVGVRRRTCAMAADVSRLAADVERGPRAGRHPGQQRRHQYPRGLRGAVGGGLGRGHRHQPEGDVPGAPRVRAGDVRPRLGPGDQPGLDPQRRRAARPRAVRGVQGRRASTSRASWPSSGRDSGVTVNAICPDPSPPR